MRPVSLVTLAALATVAVVALAAPPARAQQTTKPGQVLVKLMDAPKSDADAAAALASLEGAQRIGLRFERRSVLGWMIAGVDAADEAETRRAVDVLRSSKAVASAEPVLIERALRTPNDPLTGELWGFDFIGMQQAWDTTVGDARQRIGLVDTGINRGHADLADKDVFGFDFISDPASGGDGDGRDFDPSDDDFGGSFHGSHVAGTMLASADNGVGVPGINWNAKLVTVRALGVGGAGSLVDINEGAFWLAGGDVPNVPSIGADRVSVINLSLGADVPCDSFSRDVFDSIIAAGVTVVAAAGNEGNDVAVGTPANCRGVISVGAFNSSGALASYSNNATPVDIFAPGGEGFGDDPSTMILSVDGATNGGFKALEGTSMATPHVTGVISLMQAINPQLSPRQIKDLMLQSPFTCTGCDNISSLDAPSFLALAASTTGELTTTPPPPGGGGDNGSGAAQCPPHSTFDASEDACFCNDGFHVNAQQTGCEPDDTSGGEAGDCPAHATFDAAEDACFCDDGFVVNDAGTGCVASDGDGDGRDARNDDDRGFDSSSSTGGCSSSGAAPAATMGALALVLLGVRRRRRAVSR